ncbi:MAG: hypothetical protein LBM72_01160 [Mycoplasmataceae bacterium]|jgi:hypothetical protein|nr:hypothetical protein [Mycoplasmataceae bacterium]
MATTNNQKTLRTVAWAFSIVEVVAYSIALIAFIIAIIAGGSNFTDAGYDGDIGKGYFIGVTIVLAIMLGVAITFLVLNGKARKDTKPHIASGVLQIIFGSLISGILILCSGGK